MDLVKSSSYIVERMDSSADLEALKEEWNRLADTIAGTPIFLTWLWVKTWWEHFGHDRQLWLLTARDKLGNLKGIAPWVRENTRYGFLSLRAIGFIGFDVVQPAHLNIIAPASELERVFCTFFDYVLSQSKHWDILRFASVSQDSPINNFLTKAGGRPREGEQITSPYISFSGNWEDYLQTRSKKLRRNLKYFRSRLEADHPGEVSFSQINEPQAIRASLEKLGEFSRNRWHSKGEMTGFDYSTYINFHQNIALNAHQAGWLRLYALLVAQRVIAVFYAYRYQDRIYAYQMAFDSEWGKYSPGRLLVAHVLQASIQENAKELDWLSGDEEYKFMWTDLVRKEDELLFSRKFLGNLWIRLVNFDGAARKKARQMLPEDVQVRIKGLLSNRRKKPCEQTNTANETEL